MTYKEIQEALDALDRAAHELEDTYIANEGEVTEETRRKEDEVAAIQDLLTGEGIDSLGRWLRAKEDEKARWKAEREFAARKIKGLDNSIGFIKFAIGQVLRRTGQEKVKGSFYTFKVLDRKRTTFDAGQLDEMFLEAATEAARNAGLPPSVDVALWTNAKRLQEDENLSFLVATAVEETSTFLKPGKAAEEDE